jgi:3-deoxy-manno-octulosonate cytidylyltransferase (CMP-KDO synthetase)|tara:strand:+ start:4681 stop:4830 length:150 start_codon:yes stop_codon:yes gene_type:complete
MSFTRDELLKYIELDSTPLEIIESVDMNRFLEHRIKVKMVLTKHKTNAT